MLSTKEIADRIQQPELIQKEEISFLKELSEKHPYTQIYSILYLKSLGDTADIHFEQELQKHSYRIGDRSQLFKLIHDFSSTPISSTISTSSITEITEPSETTEVTQEEKVEIQDEVVAETINEIKEETVDIQEKRAEIKIKDDSNIAQNIEAKTIEIPNNSLEESILHHSFAANYQLNELSEEENEAFEKRKNEDEKPTLIIEKTDEKPPLEIEVNASLSFTSWLNSNKNKIKTSGDEKLEIDAVVNDSSLTFEINEFFGEVVKPKKEFFSPIKKAKESLSEEALPVSETLAKVYALQGNFPKAIYAYEQLSLKYPEKKIFFAIQIKELQKKLNT